MSEQSSSSNDEQSLLHSRPHRNMKVKIVFDPSDTHVPKPKKKKNLSLKTLEHEIDSLRSVLLQDSATNSCYFCSTEAPESPKCPVCSVTVHQKCLITNEPYWKHKLLQFKWLCKTCRKNYCIKCLERESHFEFHRCLSCDIGHHTKCHEAKGVNCKPLVNVSSSGMYMCRPCEMLVSNGRNGIDEKEFLSHEKRAMLLDILVKVPVYEQKWDVPNITDWDTTQIYHYLMKRNLPKEVTDIVFEKKLDGNVIKGLERNHVVSDMGLKLGPALRLYKEVRILQTKNTNFKVYWEDN